MRNRSSAKKVRKIQRSTKVTDLTVSGTTTFGWQQGVGPTGVSVQFDSVRFSHNDATGWNIVNAVGSARFQISYDYASIRGAYDVKSGTWSVSIGGGFVLGPGNQTYAGSGFTGVGISDAGLILSGQVSARFGPFSLHELPNDPRAGLVGGVRGGGAVYLITWDELVKGLGAALPGPATDLSGLHCFSAATHIELANNTSSPISAILPGEIVLSYDPNADAGCGALVPKRVVRVFRNVTREWIELDIGEIDTTTGEEKILHVTPGHHFLDAFGNFPTVAELLMRGGRSAQIVLGDGTLREVTGRRVVWSEEKAHLFGA